MKKLLVWAWPVLIAAGLAGCGQEQPTPTAPAAEPAATVVDERAIPAAEEAPNAAAETTGPTTEPAPEAISETDEPVDADQQSSPVQPSLRVGSAPSGPPTSARFREGTHYQKIVPAQPTSTGPEKVEVLEGFWYGCGHCFTLDPAIESWRNKSKAGYVEFVRLPAMWNETTRLHARLFYTAELLGKLDELHSLIFRELHVKGNQLNTVDKIASFFAEHGVSRDEFNKAFSSFAVESKLQRADMLNRRYRIDSVPVFIVNGKYKTGQGEAGGESALFSLVDELTAHEHGG